MSKYEFLGWWEERDKEDCPEPWGAVHGDALWK